MNGTSLTDWAALAHHRTRASKAPALFLHDESAVELNERLTLVNRRFTKPAIITPWAEPWHTRLPNATVIQDGETLDLAVGAHDLVIHAMCMHWANDPVGQLIQARRALAPDGLFLATLFGGQTLWQLRAALAEAEVEETGGLSPRVLPMAEIRDLGGLMQRAGFALPVADTVFHDVSYRDFFALLKDLRAMGETNAMQARTRRFTRRSVLLNAAKRYTSAFATPDGRLPATFEIVCLTGWAPGPGQPKPLRPGSASQTLAEALGTEETALSDPATPKRD